MTDRERATQLADEYDPIPSPSRMGLIDMFHKTILAERKRNAETCRGYSDGMKVDDPPVGREKEWESCVFVGRYLAGLIEQEPK